MALSESDLNARSLVDTSVDSPASIVEINKPQSFSQYLQSGGLPASQLPEIETQAPDPIPEPDKEILISLHDQQMWVFEGGRIIQRFLVSTGTYGHRTPTGEYSVRNQAIRAYSNKYDAWMLHWMAITPNGAYGMHALQGTSYLRRLGSVASHGCIRLSHEDAEWLYNWVDISTPVSIVADWEEPPEVKSLTFRTGKNYCL